MDYDTDKVDNMTLALLYLVSFKDKWGNYAWKGFDWDTLERLHKKGDISKPVGKAKRVHISAAGQTKMQALFHHYFSQTTERDED